MSKKNDSAEAAGATPQRPRKKPRNHRELGQAVFAEVDPVIVARGLLNSESESIKVRALETLANWAFGPPAASASVSSGRVRIIWNMPRPAREAPAWAKLAESQSQPEQSVDPGEEP